MKAFLLKSEVVLFYTFLIVLLVLSSLHLFTGYADNGDFSRSVSFIFEKPYEFPESWPLHTLKEVHQYALKGWYDKWVFLEHWPSSNLVSYSSYKLYLLLQTKISSFLSQNTQYYSVILGSISSRIIFLFIFLSLLCAIRKTVPKFIFWIFAVVLGANFLSSSWQAFLNSFYEEQIAIIFLPLIALLLYKIYNQENVKDKYFGVFLLAAFIGTTKIVFFYLPSIVALFLWPRIRAANSKLVFKKFIIYFFLAQSICFSTFLFQKYISVNAYNALYVGALMLDLEEVKSLENIGSKPVIQGCTLFNFYDPRGLECAKEANASYNDLLVLIMAHPKIAIKMLIGMFAYGNTIDIDYVAKNMVLEAPNFSELPVFNIVSKLFVHFFVAFVLLLSLLVTPFLYPFYINNLAMRSMIKTGLFFSLFGFSQYVVALADGFNETTKHLMVGNYAFSFAFVFLFPGALGILHERCFIKK